MDAISLVATVCSRTDRGKTCNKYVEHYTLKGQSADGGFLGLILVIKLEMPNQHKRADNLIHASEVSRVFRTFGFG
jgi:hypothetical protein